MHVHELIRSHPDVQGSSNDLLLRCIEACLDCAAACTICADACLAEDQVKPLIQCIRLNLDCADVCAATGHLASRRSGGNEPLLRQMLEVCRAACARCGEECNRHAGHHDHCRICAEACHDCAEACQSALSTLH